MTSSAVSTTVANPIRQPSSWANVHVALLPAGYIPMAGAVILVRAEDFVLAFCDIVIAYRYGNYETCSSLHLSYPCPGSAGLRRPSTALSGETNAALPRRSDHYRERLALKTTEQRAKITGVTCGATLAVNDVSLANVPLSRWKSSADRPSTRDLSLENRGSRDTEELKTGKVYRN
jgi:hypothetical protein